MDAADRADQEVDGHLTDLVGLVRRNAAKMPVGEPGECAVCDETKERLVSTYWRGARAMICAKCRDELKLG